MQCPKCGSNQRDGATECTSCGVNFSHWEQSQATPTTREVPTRRDPPNSAAPLLGLGAALVALILAIGVLRPSTHQPAPARGVSIEPGRSERSAQALQQSRDTRALLERLCVKDALDLGVSEDRARMSCSSEETSAQRLKAPPADPDVPLNFVPPNEVARVQVLLKAAASDPHALDQPYEIRLRLFNAEGLNVSSEGKVRVFIEPGGRGDTPNWEGTLSRSSFRAVRLSDRNENAVYAPVYTFYLSRRDISTDRFEVTVDFNQQAKGNAVINVERLAGEG